MNRIYKKYSTDYKVICYFAFIHVYLKLYVRYKIHFFMFLFNDDHYILDTIILIQFFSKNVVCYLPYV
jgi:hypothetical protein